MEPRIDDISIRHLRYALAIHEASSVSVAAARLHVAQPSLSQQLRKLESRLGVELFDRRPSGLVATEAGEEFLLRVGVLLSNLDEAVATLGARRRRARVGVTTGLNADLVALVEELVHDGGVEAGVELFGGSSTEVVADLVRGDLEFGIARLPFEHESLVWAPIASDELGVVVGRDNPMAALESVTWDDLAKVRLLWFVADRAPGFAQDVLRHIASHGWNPVRESGPASHALFQRRLLDDDSLVALRPRYAVDAEPPLRWIPFASGAPVERIGIAAVRGTRAAAIVAASRQGIADRL